MKVKALQPIYYAGQQYAPGDEYEMDDRDGQEARVLVDLGKIEMCKEDAAPQQAGAPSPYASDPPPEPPKSPARVMTTANTMPKETDDK